MTRIHADITTAVGGTPLVQLNHLTNDASARVLAKLEFYNPAGSVKDRIGVAMVDAAEAQGTLRPGGTIIEATSGNTGIALAMVGAARGYRTIIVMPEKTSKERRILIRAYGAEVILTGPGGMVEANRKVREILEADPEAVWLNQFENAVNPGIHHDTTGQEIWDDTDGKVDVFVAGVGTGGTLTGAARLLKEKKPAVHVVAVEPAESPLLTGGEPGPHRISGIGANFIPPVLDRDIYDEVADVPSSEALDMARALASQEGIFSGVSGGAACAAALVQAAKPENAGKTIVFVVPDFGERYLSTSLYRHLAD
ncbi:MAG TPA: cysteine synthase A [Microbacteriaceae bacterium]|nr:cysteine synthase A [Microbacteriaceae bacterium]